MMTKITKRLEGEGKTAADGHGCPRMARPSRLCAPLSSMSRRGEGLQARVSSNGAFTLTELIIAISILTMLTGFVAQLVNSATIVTTNSRKRMDADSQARLIFDRM